MVLELCHQFYEWQHPAIGHGTSLPSLALLVKFFR